MNQANQVSLNEQADREDETEDSLTTDSEELDYFADAPVLVVTNSRHSDDKAFISQFVSTEDSINSPVSVTQLLATEPGLNVNGQPGLFQTLSIRGLARQRIQVYVNGMRVTSERRAGIAASFIDAALMSGAEVTQGPASTYFGSGAIGGTVHLVTKQEESNWLTSSFKSDGEEKLFAFGTGNQDYTTGFAYRDRGNGETINGDEKNNHFSQLSFNFLRHFNVGDFKLDWQIIYSDGDDLGKDNLRFPTSRITSYPGEEHLLSQFTLTGDGDWLTRLYFHDQSLITQDIRPQSRINQVTTESFDFGFAYENPWQMGAFEGLVGVDYFGRRSVNSNEVETDLSDQSVTQITGLDGGKENESAIFATFNSNIDSLSFSGGVRFNYQTQSSNTSLDISDDFVTYFATVTQSIESLDVSLSYGTGFRFATLSERLFNGTTPRGQTLGNPDLKPEESASVDFGVKYSIDDWKFEAHYFETDIDNFIERVSLDADTRTFNNLTNGVIDGWQYQVDFKQNSKLSYQLSGQRINGNAQGGGNLSDIPPERHRLTVEYNDDNWFLSASYVARMTKEEFGDGELPLKSAQIVTFKVGHQINQNWILDFFIDNLLDEEYFNSADDLNTLATGREFGFNISYSE